MLKQILPALLVIVFVIGGAIGGHALRGAPAGQGDKAHAKPAKDSHGGDAADAHAKPKDDGHSEKKKKKKDDGHGGGSAADDDASAYFEFPREFVVPVMRGGTVQSLVIININLEIDAARSDEFFSMEPKLRDNIMMSLIEISNDGATFESLADVESYESLRAVILMNLKDVTADGIRNVLILDVNRQDV